MNVSYGQMDNMREYWNCILQNIHINTNILNTLLSVMGHILIGLYMRQKNSNSAKGAVFFCIFPVGVLFFCKVEQKDKKIRKKRLSEKFFCILEVEDTWMAYRNYRPLLTR